MLRGGKGREEGLGARDGVKGRVSRQCKDAYKVWCDLTCFLLSGIGKFLLGNVQKKRWTDLAILRSFFDYHRPSNFADFLK